MTQQFTLKLPDEDAARLDELISEGRYPNRHAALRTALERLLEAEADAKLVAAYTEMPDGDDPFIEAQAMAAGIRSIAEEPW